MGQHTEGRGRVREFAKGFYTGDMWKETRKAYASSVGWLCEECLAKGLYTPGKVVHHIIPLTPKNISDPNITLGWSNLRLVCQDCHARIHRQNKGKRYQVTDDGKVITDRL